MAFRKFIYFVIVMSFTGCSPSEDSPKQERWDIRKQSIELRAPDFVLEDLQGAEVRLSDYNGRDVLLVFGATWCRYCRAEIPRLKEMYSKYGEKGFDIINIYIQESYEKVSLFVDKHDINYKVVLDRDGNVARRYGIRGVPTHCLVSREGMILCMACRYVDILLDMLFEDENVK